MALQLSKSSSPFSMYKPPNQHGRLILDKWMKNNSSNIFKSTIAFSVKPIVFIIFYLVYNNAQRCYHKSTDRISASVCLPADSWHIYHHQQIFACFLSFQLLLLCIMLICAWDIYTLITGILDVIPENVHDSCLMLPPLFIFLKWRHLTHIKKLFLVVFVKQSGDKLVAPEKWSWLVSEASTSVYFPEVEASDTC